MVTVPTSAGTGSDQLAGAQIGIVAAPYTELREIEAQLVQAGAVVRRISPSEPSWWQHRRYDAFLVHVAADPELDPMPTDGPSSLYRRLIVLFDVVPEMVKTAAADFVVAPFHPAEVVTRLDRVLRDGARRGEVIGSGNLLMETARRTVTVDGHPVDVTYREFEVLRLLLAAGGAVLSRDDLQRQIAHGGDGAARGRAMDLHIHRLRAKLRGWVGGGVETVRNVGYRAAGAPGSISGPQAE